MWVVYNVSLNMRFVYNCRVQCVKFIRAAAEIKTTMNFNSFHNITFISRRQSMHKWRLQRRKRSDLIVIYLENYGA